MKQSDKITNTKAFPNPFEQSVSLTPPPVELSRIQNSENKKSAKETSKDTQPQADLEAAKEELAARARELDQREQQLNEKEKNLLLDKDGANKRNWPPFCPLVVFSITEVPPKHRLLCKIAFFYFHVHLVALVYNAVFNIVDFEVVGFVMSTVYVVVGVPVAWNSQYQRLHKALRMGMNSDIRLLMCMLNYGVGVLFNGLMALGFAGGAGIFTFPDVNSVPLKVMLSLSLVLWIANVAISFFLVRGIVGVWKGEGGTSERAKAAMASEAIHHVSTSEEGSWASRTSQRTVVFPKGNCVLQ
eukprot:c2324_g1_i1.p1 GENE.c2324_g1_i1~~c2324_g1_i1.p1  ORF type:complete len:308 (-),score=90.27 c2324_g1_i1:242-1141(-)